MTEFTRATERHAHGDGLRAGTFVYGTLSALPDADLTVFGAQVDILDNGSRTFCLLLKFVSFLCLYYCKVRVVSVLNISYLF